MKIALIVGSTYLLHPTAQVFKGGEVYDVEDDIGLDLLKKRDDLGRPFFRNAPDEPVTAPAVERTDYPTDVAPRRRAGRPPSGRDSSGEIDTAIAV
jgi:hypothetical protein